MKNKIQDLRNALFALLEDLQDPNGKMTLDRARAINETAQSIINTAKVELEYLDLVGGTGTGFIEHEAATNPPQSLAAPARPRLVESNQRTPGGKP